MHNIKYPYLPEGRTIEYVPADNQFIRCARFFARLQSLDRTMPGVAVVVRNYEILGIGANGSDYHSKHGCERVRRGCPTGQGYELCEGCHPKNHDEPRAIVNAGTLGNDPQGTDLYLWGHWWCCQWCWDAMIEAGINNVYLTEQSEVLFNKEHPDNIVGRQFST
jgi:deoxycytidylate deaminase